MGIYGHRFDNLIEISKFELVTEKFNLSSKIKSIFNSYKTKSTENANKVTKSKYISYGETSGLQKSTVDFLGSPIYYDPKFKDFDPVVQELKKTTEDEFKSFMKECSGFFTKQYYGADIKDTNKYTIPEVIIDIDQDGYLYTIIGLFDQESFPFSVRIRLDVKNNNISSYPGNIRINK